uniref:Uncharacterized protein n=1 Tax=Anguilla anguilla TaxID=7936 RepID=A0A0E9PI49_ANGAN
MSIAAQCCLTSNADVISLRTLKVANRTRNENQTAPDSIPYTSR